MSLSNGNSESVTHGGPESLPGEWEMSDDQRSGRHSPMSTHIAVIPDPASTVMGLRIHGTLEAVSLSMFSPARIVANSLFPCSLSSYSVHSGVLDAANNNAASFISPPRDCAVGVGEVFRS